MSAQPYFSIIVPTFNAAETLEASLNSVTNQGFTDWECLVVDDGSQDASLTIANDRASQDPRILVFSERINRGPGPPSNFGLSRCTGKYVLFLHSDDELRPGALDALFTRAEEKSPDLLFFGAIGRQGDRSQPLHNEDLARELSQTNRNLCVEDDVRLLFWPPAAWTRCYKRTFLNEWGFSFPDGSYEDIPWSMETTLAARSISVLNFPVYTYWTRGSNSSITTSLSENSLARVDQVRVAREHLERFDQTHLPRKELFSLMSIHLIWANLAAEKTIPARLRTSFFETCSVELQRWERFSGDANAKSKQTLFPEVERRRLARIMLSGDYRNWLRRMRIRQHSRKLKRYLNPNRWGIFKAR